MARTAMAKNSSIPPASQGDQLPRHASADRVRSALVKASTGERSIRPAPAPGIGVSETRATSPTNKSVFAIALVVPIAVFVRALISPADSATVGVTVQSWVGANFGWSFGALVVVIMVFMFVVGFGPTGNIRLGSRYSGPDYSR